MTPAVLEKRKLTSYDQAHSYEWLETNGLGGWASSTVAGSNSRRYHGLLVAPLSPPVNHAVLVSKLEETLLVLNGKNRIDEHQRIQLSSNQFPGVIYPTGNQYLTAFERGLFPVFYYKVPGIELKKTIACIYGENTTVVIYEVCKATTPFRMELLPLYAARQSHNISKANDDINKQFYFRDGVLRVKNYSGMPEVCMSVPLSTYQEEQNWYYNFEYTFEQERGMDFREDLYTHGKFCVELKQGSVLGVILSTDDPEGRNAVELLEKERLRREALVKNVVVPPVKRLILAADQFVVKRGRGLKSIMAGYHWFTDWGRDAMIALPGLCLATGRKEDAKRVLKAFAGAVSDGMIPRRFPDDGSAPEYSSMDATFWFFYAVYRYYKHTNDVAFIRTLVPLLENIIAWHYQGTRYDIHVDSDGLLTGSSSDMPLTWMDARIGDWVITPRRGKAVEVNALWYNALCTMAYLLEETGDRQDAEIYKGKARNVKESFTSLFWNENGEYLYDYVDGDVKNAYIRPNQVYAISLPFAVVDGEKARKILNAIEVHLLTPVGLRSLAPVHESYRPVYEGDCWSRDASYHQGATWSFLIGAYIDALLKVRGNEARVRAASWMDEFLLQLNTACVGTINEIFDGEAPHSPKGCVARATTVAEMLRVIVEYKLFGDVFEMKKRRREAALIS